MFHHVREEYFGASLGAKWCAGVSRGGCEGLRLRSRPTCGPTSPASKRTYLQNREPCTPCRRYITVFATKFALRSFRIPNASRCVENSTACPSRTRFGRPTDTLSARDCKGGAPILAQEEEKTALPHVEQAHGRSPMCTATPAGHPPGCTAKLTETGRKRSLSVSAWSKTAPRPTEEASAMTKCWALVRKGCKTGADVTAARSKPA